MTVFASLKESPPKNCRIRFLGKEFAVISGGISYFFGDAHD